MREASILEEEEFLFLFLVPLQHEENVVGWREGFLSPQARATEQEHQIGVDSSRKTSREVTGREPSWGAEDGKVGGPAGARAVSARSCSCQSTLSRHTKSQRQRPQPLSEARQEKLSCFRHKRIS